MNLLTRIHQSLVNLNMKELGTVAGATGGAAIGAGIGFITGGPPGAAIGAEVGAVIGGGSGLGAGAFFDLFSRSLYKE